MKLILGLSAGVAIGLVISWLYSTQWMQESSSGSDEKQPLYWVAPMDANYKRDGPGLSPMGMELVPVFDETKSDSSAGPGAISVASNVINSLGVRTAPVELKALNQRITAVAHVGYNQEAIVHVHPRVEGWVETLHARAEGDYVKAGEPLYVLYSPQLVNAQEEYVLALKRNNPRLIQAARERLSALALNKAFIQRLRESGRVQQSITYYAPQSGVISDLSAREGLYVKPSINIMTLVSLDEVWLEASVMQSQVSTLAKGAKVEVHFDNIPGKPVMAQVDYIYPSLDPVTRTARVRIRLDNPKGLLKPGMFARVIIQALSDDPVLTVPREAVIRTGRQNRVVLALGNGQFKSIAVTLGQADHKMIEITEGLTVEDEVVVSSQFLLDSESSKTSDFLRMQASTQPESVWVEATVDMIMLDSSMIKLTHQAIDDWDWPVMTMMFTIDDKLDISKLKPGVNFHAQLQRRDDNEFVLIGVHVPEGGFKNNSEPSEKAQLKDTELDHSTIDHSTMDHGAMNHD